MLASAARYRKYLHELQDELVALTGDPDPDFGLCCDAVWGVGNWSATRLIKAVAGQREKQGKPTKV